MDFKQITHKFLSLIISLLIVFGFLIIIQNSSEAGPCHRDADNKIVIGSIDSTPVSQDAGTAYDKDNCTEEPLNYKIKFYRVMLCTSETYVSANNPNFSSCSDIFNNTSGKDVVVTPGAKANLFDGGVSLPLGTFGYMAIILSNHLGIKHNETFALTNGDDATIKGYGASSHSSGTKCWTVESFTTYTGTDNNGTDSLHSNALRKGSAGTSSDLGVACGASLPTDGTYTYTFEIIDNLHDSCDPDCADHGNFRAWLDGSDTGLGFSAAGTLLKSGGTELGTTREEAVRIGYHIAFDTPITVSEDTKSFDMSFNTSQSVSFDLNIDGGVVTAIKNGANPFAVKVTAGE